MSLKDRQLKRIESKAIKDELLAGRMPNTANVEKRIAHEMSQHTVGSPHYVFQAVEENERSNAEQFNDSLYAIKEDLSLLYEEVSDQNDMVAAMSELYATEKRMLQRSVHKVERRIHTLSERLNNRTRKEVIDGTFRTFNEIDFLGTEEQGIPKTDAFINLENGSVSLRNIVTGITKYDLNEASYRIEPQLVDKKEMVEEKEEHSFLNAMKDTINEAWRYVITKTKTELTYVDVVIDLKKKVEATRLSLSLHSPKETEVTLYLSEDGVTYKELKSFRSFEKIDWTFAAEVQYMKLRFQKNEPDFVNGTEMEYLFGISHFSLKKETYAKESKLVSSPFPVRTNTIDQITLQVEDSVAPQTNIQYYVGVDDKENFVEWQEVRANQTIRLHQLASETSVLNSVTGGYGEKVNENFGVSFYSVASLEEAPLEKKTSLYIGEYMWRIDTKKVENIPDEFLPSYQEWHDIRGMATTFLPIEETYGQSEWKLEKDTLQRFTTHIYCEKEENVYNTELAVGDSLHQVYVNNSFVKPIVITEGMKRYRYNYRFQPGWNKIEILTYAKQESPFKPDLYFRDISTHVYAINEPLKEVSPYDLYHNTSRKSVDRFAIEDHRVVVNYDPRQLDVTGKGMRYVLQYNYLPKDARLVRNLRFMAVLSRQDDVENSTPSIKGYKLILE